MWQITDMPAQRGRGDDYVGWMRWGDTHVKIQISPDGISDADARLIIQNLAGIITDAGLDQSLSSAQSGGAAK